MLRPIQEIATHTPLFTRLVAVATHLPEGYRRLRLWFAPLGSRHSLRQPVP